MRPLITIGIPTFDRPTMLARALRAVSAQDYENLEVIVADNASPGDATRQVVWSYSSKLPGLRYIRHPGNIGSLANFMYLLAEAHGSYFMWLADDDEVPANYVSSLARILDADDTAVSAAGHWILMRSETEAIRMPTSHFPQQSALARVLRFVWSSDDSFFYALHRTEIIRRAKIRRYAWPNRHVLLNWAYVFLLDVVLAGRVVISTDESVTFINHDYTAKSYRSCDTLLGAGAAAVCRRLNVHYLYWEKCARVLHPLTLPLVVITSIAALIADTGRAAIRYGKRAVGARLK